MKITSFKRNIPLLGITEFFNFFGITAFWLLFLSQKNMSLFQIGLLESIFHTTSFLSEIPSGLLADRFTYKANLIISRILTMISAFLMILGHGSFWIYALGMIMSAWSYNFDSGTSSAMLYESSKEAGLEKSYLRFTSFISGLSEAARALGMVIAAFFVHGFLDYTYMLQILFSVASLIAILLLKEPRIKKKIIQELTFNALVRSVILTFQYDRRLLYWLIYSQVMITVCSMFYFYYQVEFLKFDSIKLSLIMLVSSLINVFMVFLANAIGKRYSSRQVLKSILILDSILYIILSLKFSFVHMFIFLVSDGLIALVSPIYNTDLQENFPSDIRATLLSTVSMIGSLSMVIIFPITGMLIDFLGFTQTFNILGVLLAVTGITTLKNKIQV